MRQGIRLAILCTLMVYWIEGAVAQEQYKIKAGIQDCANIRDGMGTDANVIACLAANTPVTVLSSEPYWREISFGQAETGWVAKKYIIPAQPGPTEPVPGTIPADMWLTVHFIDVGQGDAIWIHTADDGIDGNGIFEGKNIVLDGGPYSADPSNPVLPYIENEGHHGATLDAMIMTHPHVDHYRGAESLSRHFEVVDFYDPGYPSTKEGYLSFLVAMRDGKVENGVLVEPPRAQNVHLGKQSFGNFNWGSELETKALYAWDGNLQDELGSGNTVENNSSIVIRLVYGNRSFLFMGDAEGKDREDDPSPAQYVEQFLLAEFPAAEIKSTVLKIAHHGSETSSATEFIETVDPEIVVVQSGRQNFGSASSPRFLPDSSTLRRYCCFNPDIRIYRTDQNDESEGLSQNEAKDGDNIVIRTNGTDIEVNAFEGGQPMTVNSCQPAC